MRDGTVGMVKVAGVTVVTIGHQVLFARGSFKFKFDIPTLLTTLIYFRTLFANPEVVVRPVEIFQSIKVVGTDTKVMNPVAGNT